ncbi:yos-9 [Symbiodinium natans]|uniref:Yos-9 protein n=1 Tax=Symbiodinium natans TaxID=878477 RepID=A0A812UK91_9DINO|nr:yos-9 [Symbiodinium natans]
MKAEDWQAAVQALFRCLRLEPADTASLRKLAQSLFRCGELERSREVLAQLKTSEGVSEDEEWLMMRLKRRFEKPWYHSAGEVSSKEAEFVSLSAARAKRRKCARQARELPAIEQCLMRLSVVDLMQTMRTMVTNSLPPFQPVVFVLRGANEDDQQQDEPMLEDTARRTPAAMTTAVLDSLRSLMVEPWPLSGSAVQWLLHILASDNASPAMFEEESQAVAGFLALPGDQAAEGQRSRCQTFRSWLFEVLRFTSERGRERLRVSVDHCKLTALQAELLGGAVLLSRPLIRSEVETHLGVRAFWASSTFLAWVDQSDGCPGEDPDPRHALRSFVQEFGLSLADARRDSSEAKLMPLTCALTCKESPKFFMPEESCVMASSRLPWLHQPALSLLRALAQLACLALLASAAETAMFRECGITGQIGLAQEEHVRLRMWMEGAVQEMALLRCRALQLAAGGITVQTATGEELTSDQVEKRLQQVRQGLARQEEANDSLGKKASHERETMEQKQEEIEDDEEVKKREQETAEVARSIMEHSGALPSPLATDQTRVQEVFEFHLPLPRRQVQQLNRFFRLEAKSTGYAGDAVVLALEKILSQLAVSLVELALDPEEGEYKMVQPPYFDGTVSCTRSAALLLDKAAQMTQPLEAASESPLLLGVRQDAQFGAFLHPACEHLVFASTLLIASLTPRVLAGSISRDWCPLLHGLLSLNLKILSLNLLAPDKQQEPARGGSLMVRRGTAAALPRHKLWQRLCRLYRASHDLALELTEHFLRRTVEWDSDMSKLSWASWDNFKVCIARLFGNNRLSLNRISASEDSLLSMPHVLLSSALRAEGPTIRTWRERCHAWQKKVAETVAPSTWKASLEVFQQEEMVPSAGQQDMDMDDKEDIETCRVVARCLSSFWPLPAMDPEECSTCKRDGPFKRMLNNNLTYCVLGETSQTDDNLQSKADRIFPDSGVTNEGSEVPPHILGLAAAVNQRLDPTSASSLRFLKALASQLDAQLFKPSTDSFQPQAVVHPFTLNASCMMNMLNTELLPEQCSQPFSSMIQSLAGSNALSDRAEAVPASCLKVTKESNLVKSIADLFEQLLKKRERFHQMLLEVPPSKRHTAKMPRAETAAMQMQMDQQEVFELKEAKELMDIASQVPALTVLPFDNPYETLLKRSPVDCVQGQKHELLEALICISKAVAISPACEELWWSASQVFLQLLLLQDDADALAEPWSQKLQVFTGSSDMNWSQRWRFLYGQARMLNQAWQYKLTDDLTRGVRMLKAGQSIPELLSQTALRWFERQLEVLVLLRCRKRYFATQAQSNERRLAHLKRCKRTALSLLWFLIHCSDLQGVFQYATEAMAAVKGWEEPAFAEAWRKFSSSSKQPLLCFRGTVREALPAYLWYVPYILGRIEWKLWKLSPASTERLDRKIIICLLMDACHVELEVRDSLLERKRVEFIDTEPSFRLHAMRLAILFGSADGYESAGMMCYDVSNPELSRNNVMADALKGMYELAQMDKWYMCKYYACEARAHLDVGDLRTAADGVDKVVDETLRGRQFQAPFFECINPFVMHCQRVRKDESRKWAAMKTCLQVHRAIMESILGQALAAVGKLDDVSEFAKYGRGVHPGCRTKVANAMKSLDQSRPESWQALFQVKRALLRLVLASFDTESNTSFELAQTVYLLRNIRQGFNALIKANARPEGSPALSSRPYLDWRLFGLLRHLCNRCQEMQRFLEDRELRKEIDLLQTSFAAAAGRLFCFGLGGIRAGASIPDEDFFESLQSQMPKSRELKDLMGIAIDEELDAPTSGSFLGRNSTEVFKEDSEGTLHVNDD